MLTVAEALLNEIAMTGAEYIFLVPGAHITPLMEKLNEHEKLTPIIANHELAAGFMAIGYAHASGKTGIVFSIGGPGAAYMIGAAVTAKTDDVPVLFVTGDIPSKHHGYGEFQDSSREGTNDSAIFREALGDSQVCLSPEDLSKIILEINQLNVRKTPLHVQIPIDVQSAHYSTGTCENITISETTEKFTFDFDRSKRTVLLIGHETHGKIDTASLIEFANRNSIGVITDLKARGSVPENDDTSLGYIGFNSDPRALTALSPESGLAAEQIIAVGVKATLIKRYINSSFAVINISPENFNSWLNACTAGTNRTPGHEEWLHDLRGQKKKLVSENPGISTARKVNYSSMFAHINNIMDKDAYYCLDAGQIRRAGSILLTSHFPGSILQSDILSPMGVGICSAIGVKLACPEKQVISMFGDGSMRMHGLELATAVRYDLPVIFILCDNQSYASILSRTGMEDYAPLPETNWKMFAESIGLDCFYSENESDFEQQLLQVSKGKKPVLLWVRVPELLDVELIQIHELEYNNWLTAINKKHIP